MADTAIQIGELSRRTGCNIETIRYYERVGLLPKASRAENGRRFYDEADVQRALLDCPVHAILEIAERRPERQ